MQLIKHIAMTDGHVDLTDAARSSSCFTGLTQG